MRRGGEGDVSVDRGLDHAVRLAGAVLWAVLRPVVQIGVRGVSSAGALLRLLVLQQQVLQRLAVVARLLPQAALHGL